MEFKPRVVKPKLDTLQWPSKRPFWWLVYEPKSTRTPIGMSRVPGALKNAPRNPSDTSQTDQQRIQPIAWTPPVINFDHSVDSVYFPYKPFKCFTFDELLKREQRAPFQHMAVESEVLTWIQIVGHCFNGPTRSLSGCVTRIRRHSIMLLSTRAMEIPDISEILWNQRNTCSTEPQPYQRSKPRLEDSIVPAHNYKLS
ncbi:hypothetical protein HYALB_00001378 [Hymenoscyphus albidus]|uniref:Uncharacterized protein n=1 Tax=Hymenoscyphus albidus TaxID=595503 RepID=A0A9N9LDI3_9HELO|nr:hypothetical protein HYALB_00001378 [Hymenoscyphus albidus]